MNNIEIEKKEILEYIVANILDMRNFGYNIASAKYHHNASYKDAPSICKYGILTLEDLNYQGIRSDSSEILKIFSNIESHINSINSVSLSVVGLTDLYLSEDEYDPFSNELVDFLITSDLKTFRSSMHYGNEFLSFRSIYKEELRSIDIRLLKLINSLPNDDEQLVKIISNYNNLLNVALEIEKQKLDIPIREMSDNCLYNLDIDKMVKQPKLVLKR